ncbi:hypothetical protein FHETE_9641 [Fusarium heterosporum]|uniref:Uncharacterized protein n=1 Tax=Fusarium heterosporum TaxID=42747 RepID=A0A8H5WI45_FUSHE|nr:hypothetical protein FHETE_9641 [Fusarium heterosporum]
MTTPTPTATERPALTTPFEQPEDCASNFVETTKPSCYPSGWQDVMPESRFEFFPANKVMYPQPTAAMPTWKFLLGLLGKKSLMASMIHSQ